MFLKSPADGDVKHVASERAEYNKILTRYIDIIVPDEHFIFSILRFVIDVSVSFVDHVAGWRHSSLKMQMSVGAV